jgi:hypothetical protein
VRVTLRRTQVGCLQDFSPTSVCRVAARLLPEVAPDMPTRQRNLPSCRRFSKTGATGLEPATSGVTGHFEDRDVNDHGLRIAVFVRFLG